jgi:hypothetical protein
LTRCAGGSLRQASAITTALSPPSKMSMTTIWLKAAQKWGLNKNSKADFQKKWQRVRCHIVPVFSTEAPPARRPPIRAGL